MHGAGEGGGRGTLLWNIWTSRLAMGAIQISIRWKPALTPQSKADVYLVPSLRKSGAMPLLRPLNSWRAQGTIYILFDLRSVSVGFLARKLLLVSAFQGVILLSMSVPFCVDAPYFSLIHLPPTLYKVSDWQHFSVCTIQSQCSAICLVAFPRLASLTGASVIMHWTRS
jgi:hypothetical protein